MPPIPSPSLSDLLALAQQLTTTSAPDAAGAMPGAIARDVAAICQQLAQDLDLDPTWLLPLLTTLAREAATLTSYSEAANLLLSQRQSIERLLNLLQQGYSAVQSLAASYRRRQRLNSTWWEAQRAELAHLFETQPLAASQRWYALYAGALVDGQLAFCRQLAREQFAFPPDMAPQVLRYLFATEVMQAGRPEQALDVLLDLVEGHLTEQTSAEIRADIWVFIGRIYLQRRQDAASAQSALDQALSLAPRRGFVQAAFGHFYHQQGQARRASPYFRQAIDLAPDEPDGYVGLALLAESQEWWSDANTYYTQAVAAVSDEAEPVAYLGRLLGPVSGNLLYHLARQQADNGENEAALITLTSAHEKGLKDDTRYPDRLYYRLKGDVLRAAGRLLEAGAAYHSAAQYYYWLSDYAPAAQLFRRAWRSNRADQANYWYLADILRLQSYTPDPPYVIPALIRRSCAVWQAGAAKGAIPRADSWALLARATIADRLARVPGVEPTAHWWTAAMYVERALLCEAEARRWSALAMYYRFLDLDHNGLAAARHALAETESRELLEELAGGLINIGDYEEAVQVLDRLLAESDTSAEARQLYQGWQAIGYYYLRDFDKALALVEEAFKPDTADIWERKVRANIRRMAGQPAAAQADYAWLWAGRDDPLLRQPANQLDFGWAAYHLGRYREAMPYLEARLETRDDAFDAALDLGLCYLALGMIPAARARFQRSLDSVTVRRQADDAVILLDEWLAGDLVGRLTDMAQRASALATVQHFRRAFDAWRPTSEGDLALQELDGLGDEAARVGSPAWLAVQAARARLQTQAKQWAAAAIIYRSLSDPEFDFPEARYGLETVYAGILTHCQTALKAGDFFQAQELAQAALTHSLFEPDAEPEWQALAGLAYLGGDQPAAAAFAFDQALAAYQRRVDDPGSALGAAAADNIASLTHYWQIDDYWRARAEAAPDAPWAAARRRLRAFLETTQGMTAQGASSAQMLPVVTTLAVELGRDLAPPGPSAEWPLLTTLLPDMRARLQAEMGVTIPGLRLRLGDADFDARSYLIMLDEVPVVMGNIPPDALFAPHAPELVRAAGVPSAAIHPALIPVAWTPGAWIDAAQADLARQAGLTVWPDPHQYLAAQVEDRARRALPLFLGAQEVANLLESWSQDAADRQLVAAVLPDTLTQARFGRLLRALVAESVPLVGRRALLQALQADGLPNDDIHDAWLTARLALRGDLPGNQPHDAVLDLPLDLENAVAPWVSVYDGRRYLALPPEEAQQALRLFQAWRADHPAAEGQRAVFGVRQAALRPFIRRLLQLETPDLLLIAHSERLDGVGAVNA